MGKRNVASRQKDVALTGKIYIHKAEQNLDDALAEILSLPEIKREKIRFILIHNFEQALAYDIKIKRQA